MKRKQHVQSFLSVCNKRLLSATARHAEKRPSEQFAVSFFADYLSKEETSDFYSRPCFVIFKLNLLPKLKKLAEIIKHVAPAESAGATCGLTPQMVLMTPLLIRLPNWFSLCLVSDKKILPLCYKPVFVKLEGNLTTLCFQKFV